MPEGDTVLMRCGEGISLRERVARAALALLASALIFGPFAAQAGNQLFEASWTVKALGNERTGGSGASAKYSAFGLPQGVQCSPIHPRCPFVSTPTDGWANSRPRVEARPGQVRSATPGPTGKDMERPRARPRAAR